jgi:hypothetical protein
MRPLPLARLALALLVPLLLGAESGRPPRPELARFHLKLHAPRQAGIYFTAWADGDVVTDRDGSDGQTVVYRRRFVWYDDCTWESSETLTPVAKDRYDYKYREVPISCPRGKAPSGVVTPLDGHVTVHPQSDDRPLTPLVAWVSSWSRTAP